MNGIRFIYLSISYVEHFHFELYSSESIGKTLPELQESHFKALTYEPHSVGSEHLLHSQSKYHSSRIFLLRLKFPDNADRY